MKKTWVRNTFVAILALALVLGVCSLAMADATVAINQGNQNLSWGESVNITGSFTLGADEVYESGSVTSSATGVVVSNVTFDGNAQTFSATLTAGNAAATATITAEVVSHTNAAPTTPLTGSATITVTVNNLAVTGDGRDAGHRLQIPVDSSAGVTFQYGVSASYDLSSSSSLVEITADKKIKGLAAGDAEVTLSSHGQTATVYVTVTRLTPTLSVTTPAGTTGTSPYTINVNDTFTAQIATNSNGDVTWTNGDATKLQLSDYNAARTTALVKGLAATSGGVSVTVSTAQTARYDQATVVFYVKVATATDIYVEKTNVAVAVGGSVNVYSATRGGGNLTAVSADNTVATVSVPGSDDGNITITGAKIGTTKVTVGGTGTGSTKVINVTVGNPVPTITLAFNPNVTALGYGDSTYMQIAVANPTAYSNGTYYAWIKCSNSGVQISGGGSWLESKNSYWVPLDNNGVATVLVSPRYTTRGVKVTVGSAGAVSQSRTFTVSGYPALPQTGQDFTLIYVLGACCLVAAATWVIVYAKKKKNSPIA